jgi:hypothetical protein
MKYKITKVGILSSALVFCVAYGAFGLLVMAPIIAFTDDHAMSATGGAYLVGTWLGWPLGGFVGGTLWALFANLALWLVGGWQVRIESVVRHEAPAPPAPVLIESK